MMVKCIECENLLQFVVYRCKGEVRDLSELARDFREGKIEFRGTIDFTCDRDFDKEISIIDIEIERKCKDFMPIYSSR